MPFDRLFISKNILGMAAISTKEIEKQKSMKTLYFLIDRMIHFTIGMAITIPVALIFHWIGYSSDARSFMAGSIFMLYLCNTWNHRFINYHKSSKSDDHDMQYYVEECPPHDYKPVDQVAGYDKCTKCHKVI